MKDGHGSIMLATAQIRSYSLIKTASRAGLQADLYFWRDNHGLEVDLAFEHEGRLHAVECKSGSTYSGDWLAPARRWRGLVGAAAADPILVYGGAQSLPRDDHLVLSWRHLGVPST